MEFNKGKSPRLQASLRFCYKTHNTQLWFFEYCESEKIYFVKK